ncbi:fibronectin type III domain-containing protein [Nocardioides ultimimeridianus]
MLVPLLPARIVNSSTGLGLSSDMTGDQTKSFNVLGTGGVPSSGVTAVVLSVTATTATTQGYMKLWTAGDAIPASSQMWHQAGERTSNLTTLVPSSDGKIAIYNSSGTVSIRVDVEAYYTTTGAGAAGFFALPQQRVVDSTTGLVTTQSRISTGGTRTFKLAGLGGIPSTGVSAAVINVTAVNPTGDTYLYVWPASSTRPAATAVQAPSGQTTATQVVTKLDSEGKISVQNSGAPTDFFVDVQGYYTSANGAVGSAYVPLTPKRVVATPAPKPASAHTISAGNYETFQIAGTNGIPLANVNALQLVITAQSPTGTANGQVTAFPTPLKNHWGSGTAITYVDSGVKGVNSAILPVSASGTIDVRFSGSGTVDIYIDVYGYFSGTTLPTAPTNVAATAAQGGATVTWSHPSSDGRSPITSYRVTNVQTGASQTVTGMQTSATMKGLSAGSSFTFTVAAINGTGTGPESATTAAVTPTASLGPVTIYSPLYRDGATSAWLTPQDLPALFWADANANTDHYEVSKDGGPTSTSASGDDGVSWYPDAGSHTFKVRAIDASGNAGPWTQITFTIEASQAPAQATGLTSLPDSTGSLNLSAVAPSAEGHVVTKFYVNGSDGNPLAGAPFYEKVADAPGERVSTYVDINDYGTRGPIDWWVVTCHVDQCSAPTAHQTTDFGTPVGPLPTHQVRLPASLINATQLQTQPCATCEAGHLYLGGPSGADNQGYLVPDVSQFDASTPIVAATLHLHAYGTSTNAIEEDQVLDPSQVAGAPIENDDLATVIDSQAADANGSVTFDITNLLSIWAQRRCAQGRHRSQGADGTQRRSRDRCSHGQRRDEPALHHRRCR